jgi:hypothetical protein
MARSSFSISALNVFLGAGLALAACSSGASTSRSTTTEAPSPTIKPRVTTTTGIPLTGACPGALTARMTIDRAAFRKDDVMKVAVRLTNVSAKPCTIPREFPEPFAQHFEIVDAQDKVVWRAEICFTGMAAQPRPRTLKAGESMGWVTATIPLRKVLKRCNGNNEGPLRAGAYTVRTTSPTPNGQIAQHSFAIG